MFSTFTKLSLEFLSFFLVSHSHTLKPRRRMKDMAKYGYFIEQGLHERKNKVCVEQSSLPNTQVAVWSPVRLFSFSIVSFGLPLSNSWVKSWSIEHNWQVIFAINISTHSFLEQNITISLVCNTVTVFNVIHTQSSLYFKSGIVIMQVLEQAISEMKTEKRAKYTWLTDWLTN